MHGSYRWDGWGENPMTWCSTSFVLYLATCMEIYWRSIQKTSKTPSLRLQTSLRAPSSCHGSSSMGCVSSWSINDMALVARVFPSCCFLEAFNKACKRSASSLWLDNPSLEKIFHTFPPETPQGHNPVSCYHPWLVTCNPQSFSNGFHNHLHMSHSGLFLLTTPNAHGCMRLATD